MRKLVKILIVFILFSNCKKDEEPSVLINASVTNSTEGTVDFNSGDYVAGTTVTFTATPNDGYTFTNWINTSTNQTYTTNPLSIAVNEDTNIVANFEKITYTIAIDVIGQGEVQKSVVGGGIEFTHGSSIEFTAVPAAGYSFFYWNNDPSDTENPKRITLENNQEFAAKFDYVTAKNLVGTWEFEFIDPASKNITIIRMSIDISLNVLMTTIVNGEVISQIFTQMITISATAILIGDFAVISDLVFESASSMSMKMISIPEDTPTPTNDSEIPDSGLEFDLSGNKSQEEPEMDEDGIIIPPTDATTSSSATEDIGDVFDESFNQLAEVQSSTLVSNTIDSGTTTSTSGGGDGSGSGNGGGNNSETSTTTNTTDTGTSTNTGTTTSTSGGGDGSGSGNGGGNNSETSTTTNTTDTGTSTNTGTTTSTSGGGDGSGSGDGSGGGNGGGGNSGTSTTTNTTDTGTSTNTGTTTSTSGGGDGSGSGGGGNNSETTTSSDTISVEVYSINVTASSASNYTLSGSDRSGAVSGSDPSVTIKVGDTVNFAVDASGHPFYLKTVQGTGTEDLISGVTNNGTSNGTVSWTPTTAGTYYYQCSLHNGMYGTITVQ
jgi:plastocyanin